MHLRLSFGGRVRRSAATALVLAVATCADGGDAPPASGTFTFRAVVVSATLGEEPELWEPCDADPVLHDGDEALLSDAGGESLGTATLAGGKRRPLRDTFADEPGYAIQPEEARACTWSIAIQDVVGGRRDYELTVTGTDTAQSTPMRFVARLAEADARAGVRVALEYIGGASTVVLPGLEPR